MKNYFFLLAFLVLCSFPVVSQVYLPQQPEKNISNKIYPIAGSHLLRKQEQEVNKYIAGHPNMFTKMRLNKQSSWGFVVGSQKTWYATNTVNNTQYQTSATCRAVGVNCYIFVEDSLWNTRVDQTAVDSIRTAFDVRVPANSSKGIFQMDVDGYGNPPDVDNDPKIIILVLNIKDGFTGSGGYVAGYFSSLNETDLSGSNRAEMYYLDAYPTDLKSSSGLRDGMSTCAHEFQHMIHFNYHNGSNSQTQLTFVNEGCSVLAEVYCGYSIYPQSYYVNETNHYLLDWRKNTDLELNDYSRAARYMVYIRDQFTMNFFKYLVQSSLIGLDGLNDAIKKINTPLTFENIFTNWTIANILDDKSVDPTFGYNYTNLPKGVGLTFDNPNVSQSSTQVQPLAVQYLTFKNGSNLKITFTTTSPLTIKAIEIGTSKKRVLAVSTNTEFSEPEFGSTYQEIDFAIINTDNTKTYSYSFKSTGTVTNSVMELKWDLTEPTGYYNLSTSDTMCVTFDAVPGAKLDSIRVALRRAGSITGGVWTSTGVQSPTPLGTRLQVPITATSTISLEPSTPYPIPWPNWVKVDLRSFNLKTDLPFAIGLVIGQNGQVPGLMSTKSPASQPNHSYVYLKGSDGASPPGWYVLQANQAGDTVATWLIRAYVSFGTTDVKQVIELQPKSFSLEQNYPNPFNPSTTIEFSIPDNSFVNLKVYDLLGNEIATLVSENMQVGKHRVNWNPAGLTSGLYFYHLQAGAFSDTKKLILLK